MVALTSSIAPTVSIYFASLQKQVFRPSAAIVAYTGKAAYEDLRAHAQIVESAMSSLGVSARDECAEAVGFDDRREKLLKSELGKFRAEALRNQARSIVAANTTISTQRAMPSIST